jgi:hypothetical protein
VIGDGSQSKVRMLNNVQSPTNLSGRVFLSQLGLFAHSRGLPRDGTSRWTPPIRRANSEGNVAMPTVIHSRENAPPFRRRRPPRLPP